MVIDCHVHLGDTVPVPFGKRREVTVHQLIDRMNREGVDLTVLLPLESPEAATGWYLTDQAIRDYETYPERLLAFVAVDPRMSNAVGRMQHFLDRGCVGFGEHKTNLAFDDERSLALYKACDERGLCLLFHSDPGLNYDEVGLPRLQKCLKEFPNCTFIGHGPGWWAAISGDDDRSGGYPKEPIKPGGALDRLLAEYDNLYADISAGSGFNALTRDPDFTEGFIQRNWRKLLLGTDYMFCGQELPQIKWLREDAPVNDEQREAIASQNFLRIIKRDQ